VGDPLGSVSALENALDPGQELGALARFALGKPTCERGKIEGVFEKFECVLEPLKRGLGRRLRV
jgi:hypothetical protein